MKNLFKRIFALLLMLAMIGSMIPALGVQGTTVPEAESNLLTEQDYQAADAVFAKIDQMEESHAKKNLSETELADAAVAVVVSSDSYVDGSLDRNGNFFTWWTVDGVRCVYSPRMRQIQDEMVAPSDPEASGAYNVPVATKGSTSTEVFLVGPYYGIDDSFTAQYKNEAARIAKAIGDTDGYTLYSGKAATVDTVANAMSKGAVVIFDSHGDTDYINPNDEYDYVTGAENSYLCLTSTTGLTDADYADGALYYSDGICINGATIANHMTSQNPGGILWMAICLGMATDTMCQPMRDMGVEVVYGYSQSVTFDGDYLYEECFWDNMCNGTTVATAIADMKENFGCWDMSEQMYDYYGWQEDEYGPFYDLEEARYYTCAFPVVVSDEDTHPGQRNGDFYGADSLQTVKSTYKLNITETGSSGSDNTGVTEPVVDKAYKLYMDKNGSKLYFNGQTESASVNYRLATTTNKSEAVDVYLEAAAGGYRLYFYNGSTKTYIRVFERVDNNPGYGKGSLELVTSKPAEVLSMDKVTGTLVYTADDGENAYYMGTYNDYVTFSVSNTYYITGDNAGNVDVSQYPARLEEVDGAADSVPVITLQPVDQTVLEGKTAQFTVMATGEDLQYQWQYRTTAAGSWKDASATGNKTAALSVPATVARNGYQYRCKITDKYGNVINSEAATLKIVTLKVTVQPLNKYLPTGKTAKFTVKAVGEGLKYQWQYRVSTTGAWKNASATGNKTATLSVPATAARNGYQYRCRITDKYGNVINSKAATLKIVTLKVTVQPANKYLPAGKTAKFTVKVSGTGLKYQWQYRTSAKGNWKTATAAGNKTATLHVPVTAVRNGYQYRCKITDQYGNVIYSNAATLKTVTLKITTQPSAVKLAVGKTATFKVVAKGTGLKYQWQFRKNAKGTWKKATNKGNKTATLKVPVTAARNGYQYRCVITDKYGNVINSAAATLKVKK
ncbi:MAG: hypothetical protein IJO28_01405 [Oscillospiraceae bacterium]|nr:hypothetical protein [Oscillospiraceae bacterium]